MASIWYILGVNLKKQRTFLMSLIDEALASGAGRRKA